jgi:glutathione S-transferase
MELGYWNIKGRAELLRILLAYFGFSYKEVNPSSREEAQAIFAKYHFNFPNLPYLVDGEVQITESSAIPVYLAHKANRPEFFGKPGLDHVHHQEILGVLHDLLEIISQTITREDGQEHFKSKRDFLERKFGDIAKFLGEKEFVLGYITYADFVLAGLLLLQRKIAAALKTDSIDAKFANLKNHADRVYSLPGVKEYVLSDAAKARLFLPPSLTKLQIQ